MIRVAGVCGATAQAVGEAATAREAGYDIGLLSLAALPDATDEELLAHCRAVGQEIPLCGFYLQPSVGGRLLSYEFWREFCRIPAVVAIKVAPFNRYQTLDVLRAVADSGRAAEIALYTGNDDHILGDLLTEFRVSGQGLRFRGGLLGQWAVWTRRAVELLETVHACQDAAAREPPGSWRARRRSPMPMRRFSTCATGSPAASRGYTRFCGGRDCWRGAGASTRRRIFLPARWRKSTASARAIRNSDDDFVRENLDGWLR